MGRDCWPVSCLGLEELAGGTGAWELRVPADFVCFTERWWWQGDWRGEGEWDLKWSAGGRRFVPSAGLFCFSEQMTKSFVPSTIAVMVVLLLILMDASIPAPDSLGGAGSLDGLFVP